MSTEEVKALTAGKLFVVLKTFPNEELTERHVWGGGERHGHNNITGDYAKIIVVPFLCTDYGYHNSRTGTYHFFTSFENSKKLAFVEEKVWRSAKS